jgi:predicted phosphodiesterase
MDEYHSDVPHLRIVGDVHGLVDRYAKSIVSSGAKHSIQIGDLGFSYAPLSILPWKKHKFFGGNHDNYDIYDASPHALGDYGRFSLGGLSLYFIRGAFSIDVKARLKAERRGHGKHWWKEEQLPLGVMHNAQQDYASRRPSTMLTHTCPSEVSRMIGKPDVLKSFGYNPTTFSTPTQELLQDCFDAHKPDVWIFGHFHMDLTFMHKGTLFICLAERQALDTDAKGRFNHNGFSERLGQ